MRILLVSHYALPHLGGIEVAVDGLARELASRGHEVAHVASTALRGDEPPEPPTRSYEVERVPAWNGAEARAGIPYPLFSPRLVRVLRRRVSQTEVVHCHGYLYLSSLAALTIARRAAGVPVRVLTEHVAQVPYDSLAVRRVQAAAAATAGRAALLAAEGVVVLNDAVDAEAARLATRRPRRLIRNGVDAERFRPAVAGERERLRTRLGWDGAPHALFVGRLVEKKGVAVVLGAATRLPGVRFSLAGPGEVAGPLPPNVELLGSLPSARVAELYRAADAFVLPSRGEGFPVTVQEAMASGLPVLVGEDPSYAAVLEGAEAGVTQVAAAPDALAAALGRLVADDDARARASAAAREHARRAFSWSRAAAEHERFYEQLIGRRAGHRRARGDRFRRFS
jgi:glycosyltransferase involved in cell wall biosynthesis